MIIVTLAQTLLMCFAKRLGLSDFAESLSKQYKNTAQDLIRQLEAAAPLQCLIKSLILLIFHEFLIHSITNSV